MTISRGTRDAPRMSTIAIAASDPRITRLQPAHAKLARAVIAADDDEARDALAAPFLEGLGLSTLPTQRFIERRVGAPGAWDASSRELLALLPELGVDLTHRAVYSVPSWLRRWLGLEPAGALFAMYEGETRLEALRSRQEDPSAIESVLSTFAPCERVEVLVDLLDGGQDFRSAPVERALSAALSGLDATAGRWARTQIDTLAATTPIGRRAVPRERAVFLGLVRAGITITPAWDAFVPLSRGTAHAWVMKECLDAIPPERRVGAVIARLERCDVDYDQPLIVGLDALELVPDPAIARWIHARKDQARKPAEITDRLRALGASHPALLAALSEPDATLPASSAKKAPTKKAGTKKAGTKKAGTKKAGTKKLR